MGGWVGGRVAGTAEIITNSAQLGLELGLSLAIVPKWPSVSLIVQFQIKLKTAIVNNSW